MIRYLGKFPITDALTLYKGYKSSIPKEKLFNKYLSTDLIFEPLYLLIQILKGINMQKYQELSLLE